MKQEKSCGAIVFNKSDGQTKFLLIKHNTHQNKGGHWDFPKGHQEDNETDQQTAVREVLEETGVQVTIVDGFQDQVQYYPAWEVFKTVIFFLAESNSTEVNIQAEEIEDHLWATYEDALETLTFDSARNILRNAHLVIKEKQ